MEWISYVPLGVGISIFLVGYGGTFVCLFREKKAWRRQKMKDASGS